MICKQIKDKMIKRAMNPSKSKAYSASSKPSSQSCLSPRRTHFRIVYSISQLRPTGSSVSHTSSMKISQRLKAKRPRIRSMIMNKYHLPIWLRPQMHLNIIRVTRLINISIDEGGIIKIKAMNIIFVLDSYDSECIQRMEYFSAVL